MKTIETNYAQAGQRLKTVGTTFTAALTAPIIAGLGGAAKAAISYESAFAGVRKTVNASEAEFKALSAGILDMTRRMPASAVEIAKVAESAGQLGIKKGAILGFTETMVMLGATTNLTADQAATSMARFSNIMQTPQESIRNTASALVALGNDGASTEAEIVDMALRIAGAGKTMNMTEGDVLGLANALSSVGIEAEMGGSAISKVMINIASAASKGGKELEAYAKVAGMLPDAFAKMVKADPGQALTRFISGLGQVKREGGDLLGVLEKLDITEVRMRDTMLRVANAGDLVASSMRLGNQALRENTALQTEYEKRQQTTAAQLQVTWNQIHAVGIELGSALLPTINDVLAATRPLISAMASTAETLGQMHPYARNAAVGLALVVAAAGPLLFVGGAIVQSIGAVAGALALIAPASATMAVGATTASVALAGLKVAGGLAFTALWQFTAVGAAAVGIYKLVDAFAQLTFEMSATEFAGMALAGIIYGISDADYKASMMAMRHVEARRKVREAVGMDMKPVSSHGPNSRDQYTDNAKEQLDSLTSRIQSALSRGTPIAQVAKHLEGELRSAVEQAGVFKVEIPKRVAEAYAALPKLTPMALPDLGKESDGKKGTDPIAEAKKKMAELDLALQSAARNGVPLKTVMAEYGATITDVAHKQAIFADKLGTLPASIQRIRSLALAEEMRTFAAEAIGADKGLEILIATGRELPLAFEEAFLSITDAAKEFHAANQRTGKSALDQQLLDIDAHQREAVQKLGSIPTDGALRAEWQKGRAAIDEYFAHLRALATGTAGTIVERMRAAGVETQASLRETAAAAVRDYEQMRASGEFSADAVAAAHVRANRAIAAANGESADSLRELAGMFQQLGQIGAGSFGGILRGVGGIVAALAQAKQANIDFGGKFGIANPLFSKTATKDQKFAAGVASAGAVAQGASNIWSATGESRSAGGNALGGALAGAQMGAAFGPYGMAIGAAAGLVVGLVRGKPAWAKAADEVGRDFGVKISDGLAKEIAKTAKEKFGGDRVASGIFSLDKIIAEAGGVKPATLAGFTKNLRDAFSMKEVGKFSMEQLTETLDKNFGAMAEIAMTKGGLITAELREIMALNAQFGSESAAIAEHVKRSLSSAMGHLTSFLQASAGLTTEQRETITDELAEIDRQRQAYMGKDLSADDQKAVAALDARWDALKKQLATAEQLKSALQITNAGSGNAMAAAIAGSFQKMLGAGMDPAEALAQVEPAVTALQGQLDRLGIDGGAAFVSLRQQIAMTKDEVAGPAVSGMRSLGLAITDLYNGGVLTDDMFAGMANQIGATFQKLVAQGHDGKTAMSLMKPQLQQIWELQQRYGTTLDENTQKMLDEAEAAGLVGDKHKSASERTVDGINKVVDRLDLLLEGMGVKLPDAITDAADTVATKTGEIDGNVRDILTRIPRRIPIDVDISYNESGQPTGPDGITIPGAAQGVFATRPTVRVFGEGGEPELGGPVDFMARALAGALTGLGLTADRSGRGGRDLTVVPIYMAPSDRNGTIDGSAVNRHLASAAGVMSNEFGVREVIEHLARLAARSEMAARG